MDRNEIAIVSVKVNSYQIHFLGMSKDKAIEFIEKALLNEKTKSVQISID